MSKGNNLQSLFCGILFCISVTALVIACLAFTKKGGGKGEYYEEEGGAGMVPQRHGHGLIIVTKVRSTRCPCTLQIA